MESPAPGRVSASTSAALVESPQALGLFFKQFLKPFIGCPESIWCLDNEIWIFCEQVFVVCLMFTLIPAQSRRCGCLSTEFMSSQILQTKVSCVDLKLSRKFRPLLLALSVKFTWEFVRFWFDFRYVWSSSFLYLRFCEILIVLYPICTFECTNIFHQPGRKLSHRSLARILWSLFSHYCNRVTSSFGGVVLPNLYQSFKTCIILRRNQKSSSSVKMSTTVLCDKTVSFSSSTC